MNNISKEVITQTELKELKLFSRGKVRDIYEYEDKLFIVATDRISAFDVVLPNGIPHKGFVLNSLSAFWFEFTKDIVSNHFLTQEVPSIIVKDRDIFKGRSMLVRRAQPIKAECIVRGYLSGSAWKEYQINGSISGFSLPKNLKESDKLKQPIFTPSTKAETGHDVNITFKELENLIGSDTARKLKEISINIYLRASQYAEARGIIIADTKFEFGLYQGEIILIDEILTPDSSRFWSMKDYEPGKPQPSFDKQFVRDYLESIKWDKNPPAPELPYDIVEETSKKYLEAYKRLLSENPNPKS